jgi:mono/diheme cytochrome c family protein
MRSEHLVFMKKFGFAFSALALVFLPMGLAHGTDESAATKAAAPAAATVDLAKSRALFNDWSCNSCHVLKDAGAEGHVGPSFDGNPNLTKAFLIDRITNGQGAMPSFGGQLSAEEIDELAAYILQAAKK